MWYILWSIVSAFFLGLGSEMSKDYITAPALVSLILSLVLGMIGGYYEFL